MKLSIFPNLKAITTLSLVSLITIWGIVYQMEIARSQNNLAQAPFAKPNLVAQVIRGNSGGPVNSSNCGFISKSPNYSFNLSQRVDYMKITVQAVGGQPTLLVMGPQNNDSFCVLGDRGSGLNPEISGVWEPGNYNVFVGDRTGTRHNFTLNISRSK